MDETISASELSCASHSDSDSCGDYDGEVSC